MTTTELVTRSAAAERMRLHRERRRDGLRCLTIEVRGTEITELVTRGYLDPESRNNRAAVKKAFYRFLDKTLSR